MRLCKLEKRYMCCFCVNVFQCNAKMISCSVSSYLTTWCLIFIRNWIIYCFILFPLATIAIWNITICVQKCWINSWGSLAEIVIDIIKILTCYLVNLLIKSQYYGCSVSHNVASTPLHKRGLNPRYYCWLAPIAQVDVITTTIDSHLQWGNILLFFISKKFIFTNTRWNDIKSLSARSDTISFIHGSQQYVGFPNDCN